MPEPFSQLVELAHLPSEIDKDLAWIERTLIDDGLCEAERVKSFLDKWRSLRKAIQVLGQHLEQWQRTSGVRQAVAFFAVDMEDTLRRNDHKGGWDTCDPAWLLKRLREETDELEAVLKNGSDYVIRSESADVANFAMMIADLTRK
jgi:hypothetical protein